MRRVLARHRPDGWNARTTRDFFYHDCDEATAAWAFSQLTPAPVEFLTERVHL